MPQNQLGNKRLTQVRSFVDVDLGVGERQERVVFAVVGSVLDRVVEEVRVLFGRRVPAQDPTAGFLSHVEVRRRLRRVLGRNI